MSPSKMPRPDGTGYRSSKEEEFQEAWNEHGFMGSDIVREYRFHPVRRWRWDFAWPSMKVAVEIQGFGRGGYGGHSSPPGLIRDAEKWRAAIELGWLIIPFTSSCLSSKEKRRDAVEFVCRVLEARGPWIEYCQNLTRNTAWVQDQTSDDSKPMVQLSLQEP